MSKTPSPATRDPARVALAEAIAHRSGVRENYDRHRAAHAVMQARAFEASSKLDALESQISGVRQNAIEDAVNQALGRESDLPVSIDEARRQITAATDERDVARLARKKIEADLKDFDSPLYFANEHVKTAARAVLRQAPALATLERQAEESMRAMAAVCSALAWADSNKILNLEERATLYRFGYLSDAGLGLKPQYWAPVLQHPAADGVQPWKAAMAALMADPDAPLP